MSHCVLLRFDPSSFHIVSRCFTILKTLEMAESPLPSTSLPSSSLPSSFLSTSSSSSSWSLEEVFHLTGEDERVNGLIEEVDVVQSKWFIAHFLRQFFHKCFFPGSNRRMDDSTKRVWYPDRKPLKERAERAYRTDRVDRLMYIEWYWETLEETEEKAFYTAEKIYKLLDTTSKVVIGLIIQRKVSAIQVYPIVACGLFIAVAAISDDVRLVGHIIEREAGACDRYEAGRKRWA